MVMSHVSDGGITLIHTLRLFLKHVQNTLVCTRTHKHTFYPSLNISGISLTFSYFSSNKEKQDFPNQWTEKKIGLSEMFLLKLIRIPGYMLNSVNRIVREVYKETLSNSTHIPGILKIHEKNVPECLPLLRNQKRTRESTT